MNLPDPLKPFAASGPFAPFKKAGAALLDLLYPPHCAICLTETAASRHLCPRCLGSATRVAAPFCNVCSTPFEGEIDGEFTCPSCREEPFAFDCAVAPFLSRGVVRELIHRFKYNHQYHLRHPLAGWLAEGLADPRLARTPIDRIVPVPLHPARERDRGFNQAHVLAEFLSLKTGAKLENLLKRVRFTTSQTRLDRETRIENLRNAFRMRHTGGVRNLHLLLIDDVMTTGSTVNECARVLREAGAASVRVATVARG